MLKNERIIGKLVENNTTASTQPAEPIQLYTVEELKTKTFAFNKVFKCNIVNKCKHSSSRKYGDLLVEDALFIKVDDMMYLDIYTGKCYKAYTPFQDKNIHSTSTNLQVVLPRHYNEDSNLVLTIEEIKAKIDRSKQQTR